ncbi:sensor histidine kinase [Sulfitobacter geojensis]|uniref:C4-dicarboxylate transport sensor protein DctB n=1 Tax=Sulfitobacter geojensis TaxID=1342299 RepID=A0AAE3B5U1_9RHOB|nr:ATP-binding protein [Sulfitobacter geojensis]MBM1688489.1 sensor histidine kinase [Sulfitobacter geojensis]MBM1692556.1 sensor histidine kinase [Sulfitobacter geojensis]MBM1704722.1 sensor histidine kinase [Sulfitobacter geojensis]MBM1708780.1 sensor histidine kinase [Sulfitobacter geojensis]MBM1712845.1 sensor histidine kinase [Sulfitobacter geojensis]
MRDGIGQRVLAVLAFSGIVLALAIGVWRYAYDQGLDQLAARGQADLALAGDRLVGQLQRYRDLAVLMADHPVISIAARYGVTDGTRDVLVGAADKTAALDVLVLSAQGQVMASVSGNAPMDLGGYPFVKRALRGALGWGHGPAEPLTQRAFFHAAPVFNDAGKVQGAVVVVTDLNGIDYNWRGTNPAAFFTDKAGEVYIANRTELLFWKRSAGAAGLIPPTGAPPAFSAQRVGPHEIWQLGWGPYLPGEALHLTQALPVIGMTGEVLLDVTQTRALAFAQAAAVAALCLAFGSLLFLASERRRTLAAANVQLEARVAKRTVALRDTNEKLVEEASVREAAQVALRQAQDDLVQAGKLSALGQMSAGISHELNQPLMAIRSFAENAVQFLERGKPDRAGENLTRISEMSQRMARIIQNLRAFARQEDIAQDCIDVHKVLHAALELTAGHREAAGVTLHWDATPRDIQVRGGEVRLGQVFVNLITNAADAMAESPMRELRVDAQCEGDQVSVTFRDTGPGIEMPDKVFDPFYTTKAVDQSSGMGLGLSISYGIVQSFGGQIRGANQDGGGAVFTVILEAGAAKEQAA